jgi:16S rRNA (cytosine967-C5)-methyltransferase
VNAFLACRPDFVPLPFAEAWEAAGLDSPPPEVPAASGPHLLLSPGRHGTDGFFAAVLRRGPAG